jgi:hypothetical protein
LSLKTCSFEKTPSCHDPWMGKMHEQPKPTKGDCAMSHSGLVDEVMKPRPFCLRYTTKMPTNEHFQKQFMFGLSWWCLVSLARHHGNRLGHERHQPSGKFGILSVMQKKFVSCGVWFLCHGWILFVHIASKVGPSLAQPQCKCKCKCKCTRLPLIASMSCLP